MPRLAVLGQIDIDPPLRDRDRKRLRSELDAWSICREGCCLNLVDQPRAAEELRRVIARLPTVFRVTGLVVGQRKDGELIGIRVSNRRVYEKVLWPGSRVRKPGRRRSAQVIRLDERRPSPGS